MRLRKPCEHGLYDAHPTQWPKPNTDACPGGEFLPEGALEDAAWQFNEAVSLLRECRTFPIPAREIDKALPAMQAALVALASQVGESE